MTIYVRLPWEPLEAKLSFRFGGTKPHFHGCGCSRGKDPRILGYCWTINEAAELLGFSAGVVSRWKKAGDLPAFHADQIAVKLDVMPYEIWPEWTDWIDDQIAG